MYKSKGLKYVSIQQVKDYFVEHQYATKSEIALTTHLSLATVTNILKELLEENFILQVEDCQSTGGRKAKRYKICETFMLFGLIDLHVENQRVFVRWRVVNLDSSLVENQEYQFENITLQILIDIVNDMKKQHHIEYLSLSVPGIVSEGVIGKCDIPGLENVSLKSQLENNCNIHVTIENDVNTGMLGYIHTHDVESSSVAFIYQPDNHHSGCGLYINGAILYGATHFAGELGYLPHGTLQEQVTLLKSDPLSLLVNQVVSVIAVINPSLVILYTTCVEKRDFLKCIQNYIPKQHLPEFQFIESMEQSIFNGLACQCIESSRYKGKGEKEYGK